MSYIKNKVAELNLCDKHKLQNVREISILPVSDKYPNGCVAYISEELNVKELPLMGIALPFNDCQFDYANLSTDIFCYPELVAVKIIHESFRVAKRVRIFKYTTRKHVLWNSSVVNTLGARMSGMGRTNYHARVVNDFIFSDNGEYYTVTGGVAAKMPYVHIDNLPQIYSKDNPEKTECLLFDFAEKGLNDSDTDKVSAQNGLKIKGKYRIRLRDKNATIKLSEIILGEMQLLSIPFAYVLDKGSQVDKNDIWWKYKTRAGDKIIYHL